MEKAFGMKKMNFAELDRYRSIENGIQEAKRATENKNEI